jgi:hypothetical protein
MCDDLNKVRSFGGTKAAPKHREPFDVNARVKGLNIPHVIGDGALVYIHIIPRHLSPAL